MGVKCFSPLANGMAAESFKLCWKRRGETGEQSAAAGKRLPERRRIGSSRRSAAQGFVVALTSNNAGRPALLLARADLNGSLASARVIGVGLRRRDLNLMRTYSHTAG